VLFFLAILYTHGGLSKKDSPHFFISDCIINSKTSECFNGQYVRKFCILKRNIGFGTKIVKVCKEVCWMSVRKVCSCTVYYTYYKFNVIVIY
jgi:hypothetical protein